MATRLINDLIGKQIITKAAYPVNLYQLLATAKQDGVGLRVMPEEWLAYGNTGKNYFTVTNVNLTPGFSQGIVCAKKTWSGETDSVRVIPQDLARKVWRIVE